jgi:hypothetical protein
MTTESEITIPQEFYKIINDFVNDISTTFPEYKLVISKWWSNEELNKDTETLNVFKHCVKVFPQRFFDILYKNTDIFTDNSEVNTEFLPSIIFKYLWNSDISDTTRETIWKYLQLILFSILGSVKDTTDFGDTAQLFEAINEDELKNKLEETLENMQNLFDSSNNIFDEMKDLSDSSINLENLPNANELHEHIQNMMGGKLGKLALELAQETANELNFDVDNDADAKSIFQKLFKNPGKLMNMVKNITNKIDSKLKSGEIKESELMEEGMELLNKMKSMPGMGNMQNLFSEMGLNGLGKGGKLNVNAMETHLKRNIRTAKMKERMQSKVEANKKERESTAFCNMSDCQNLTTINDDEIIKIFSTGEKVERTPRGAKPPSKKKSKQKSKN